MSALIYYREQAAHARAKADAELLPQRRQQHRASAERWDEMAKRAEELEQRTQINRQTREHQSYHDSIRTRAVPS